MRARDERENADFSFQEGEVSGAGLRRACALLTYPEII